MPIPNFADDPLELIQGPLLGLRPKYENHCASLQASTVDKKVKQIIASMTAGEHLQSLFVS